MNKGRLPMLSNLALKFLCVKPTSAESERIFSLAGNILTPKRNRMKAENIEKLCFVNRNAKFL